MNERELRAMMVRAGYCQKTLANQMGMSPKSLSDRIHGKKPFDTGQIEVICSILGIDDDAVKAQIFLSHTSQKWDV